MKLLANTAAKLVFWVLSFVAPLYALAQEGARIEKDIDKNDGSSWYSNPIIWIVGAAVFTLLLVALLRGNNSSKG